MDEERKVGEVFAYGGVDVKVVEDEGRNPCRDCCFYPLTNGNIDALQEVCLASPCRREDRSDGLSVHYETVGMHHYEQEG